MKITLSCPLARHGPDMIVLCTKTNAPCGHQQFKACKGWWVCSPGADTCPIRKENPHGNSGAQTVPAAGDPDHV